MMNLSKVLEIVTCTDSGMIRSHNEDSVAADAASARQRTPYVWPTKRMEYDEYLELARSDLTQDEFQAAQLAGNEMTLEQAIDEVQNLSLKPNAAPHPVLSRG